ncbi:GNAT family N-acetyltransferase [Pimelobacter sp. 30-1]|uniref:GNAT family N-acetyltransferase n=1 Tax=Pimelobacter sp. 30-1 TaxID=2004991 RepID=UPI001C0483C9|nr:GNAT family N-acetyltransferase [Pimelobacter sp. 30-1]
MERTTAASVTTRLAGDPDLGFLAEVDHHVSPEVRAEVVARGRVLLAETGGDTVGFARWGLFWDEIPFLNLLWVAPGRRGQGIGTSLVAAWERAQAAAGHRTVLTSTLSSERAQYLYRRLGYVDSGALLLPGEAAEIILRKSLTP